MTTMTEKVNRALQLLSESYHNLATSLQEDGAREDALVIYSLSLLARKSAIRRDITTQSQQHRRVLDDEQAEDLALLGEIKAELDSVLWETSSIEIFKNQEWNARRQIRGLDVYPYPSPTASPQDVPNDTLPLKKPPEVELLPLAELTLPVREGLSNIREKLDSAAGLYAMALCYIEAAEHDGSDDSDTKRTSFARARELLIMIDGLLYPFVESSERDADNQQEGQHFLVHNIRAACLAADVHYSLAHLEYRSGETGNLDAAVGALIRSLTFRRAAFSAHDQHQSDLLAAAIAAPLPPDPTTLDEENRARSVVEDEIEIGTADALSLLGRARYLSGEHEAALECLDRVLEIHARHHGDGHLAVACAKYNAAIVRMSMMRGRYLPSSSGLLGEDEAEAARAATAVHKARGDIGALVVHPSVLGSSDRRGVVSRLRTDARRALRDCDAFLHPYQGGVSSIELMLEITVAGTYAASEKGRESSETAVAAMAPLPSSPGSLLIFSPPSLHLLLRRHPQHAPPSYRVHRWRLAEMLLATPGARARRNNGGGGSIIDGGTTGSELRRQLPGVLVQELFSEAFTDLKKDIAEESARAFAASAADPLAMLHGARRKPTMKSQGRRPANKQDRQ